MTPPVSTLPKTAIVNLRIDHTKGDIARAVMEAFAYLPKWSAGRAGLDLTKRPAYSAGEVRLARCGDKSCPTLPGCDKHMSQMETGAGVRFAA